MDKRSLKLASMLIVNESNEKKEIKKRLFQAIKEASDTQLINFINENKDVLQEIHPKTQTFASMTGSGFGANILWALYRKIRSKYDDCTKGCGTYELNTIRRQVCMVKCKITKTESMIRGLKGQKGSKVKIATMKAKLAELKSKLAQYEAHAKKRGTQY